MALEFMWFKTGHLVIYGALGWLVCRALLWQGHSEKRRVTASLAIQVTLIVGILAILDELHQMFIPGRGPHLRDVLIDLVGASAAVLWWQARYNRKTSWIFERLPWR